MLLYYRYKLFCDRKKSYTPVSVHPKWVSIPRCVYASYLLQSRLDFFAIEHLVSTIVRHRVADTISCDAPCSAIGIADFQALSCEYCPPTQARLWLAIGHLYWKEVGVHSSDSLPLPQKTQCDRGISAAAPRLAIGPPMSVGSASDWNAFSLPYLAKVGALNRLRSKPPIREKIKGSN